VDVPFQKSATAVQPGDRKRGENKKFESKKKGKQMERHHWNKRIMIKNEYLHP